MSSAAYLSFIKPISHSDWLNFCKKEDIEYSPNTVGWNVYYDSPNHCGVEIKFGKTDFNNKQHPEFAEEITVSSFYGRNLERIAEITTKILSKFNGVYDTWDEGIRTYMEIHTFEEILEIMKPVLEDNAVEQKNCKVADLFKARITPAEFDAFMINSGFTQDSLEHNGWQWDFWINYSKDNTKICASGCGFWTSFKATKEVI